MTSQGSAYTRFQRAISSKNMRMISAAAAELPRIGVAEAAAMLLVIEQVEPDSYDRAAVRWLAKLCTDTRAHVDLEQIADAATALDQLPQEPGVARGRLADICQLAGLQDAARVFTGRPAHA